jgi:hypothetical protein
MRVSVWYDRKPSKRNYCASEQSKGSFHRGSFVAIPAIVPQRSNAAQVSLDSVTA